jgi:hypothetical protein
MTVQTIDKQAPRRPKVHLTYPAITQRKGHYLLAFSCSCFLLRAGSIRYAFSMNGLYRVDGKARAGFQKQIFYAL